jgi:hypothetical protein
MTNLLRYFWSEESANAMENLGVSITLSEIPGVVGHIP